MQLLKFFDYTVLFQDHEYNPLSHVLKLLNKKQSRKLYLHSCFQLKFETRRESDRRNAIIARLSNANIKRYLQPNVMRNIQQRYNNETKHIRKKMKDISIKEIIDLATQDIQNPELELKKVYDWHHDRKIMIIKGTVGISISLIITLSIAYYKDEIKVNEWNILYPLILATLTMTYGVFELSRIKKVGKKYVAAIMLLNRFKKIKPFLTVYKKIIN